MCRKCKAGAGGISGGRISVFEVYRGVVGEWSARGINEHQTKGIFS